MNNIIKPSICLLAIVFLNVSMLPVKAGIFKCVSTNGKTYFVDKPCPADNIETELRAVKDPENGYIPDDFVPDTSIDKTSGVVVGKSSGATTDTQKNDDDNNKVMIGGDNGNQSTSQNVAGGNDAGESTVNSGHDVVNQQTKNDYNLNEKSKSSKKTSNKKLINVTIIEPSVKSN